ncbi:diguanylate cyclase/phosphodiesterase (GGDEF & EAL domains) with PAS/PAC sensor(s) [Pseudoalteromonas luteoviolacea B = ATCC 29581]|nr:diguanylate cyclase/phosphodiesterase (GGDEF & EAL domains) with PAS/PAC sensor(s) [Pseudoalteromonas luteoviolacea B = ATCC 29581]
MRFTLFYVLLLVLLANFKSIASDSYAQRLSRLSVNEGLSQSVVSHIVQDPLGYVWIGTEQGLNRYDGYQVSVIKNGFDFSDKPIHLLRVLTDGQIFVSTGYSGSYLIDSRSLNVKKIYTGKLTPESSLYSPISAIVERGNTLYVGIGRQVFTIDLRTLESKFLVALPETVSLVRALTFIGNDLLVGSDVGLYRFSITQHLLSRVDYLNQQKADELNQNVKFLKFESGLGLLIGTVKGMYVLPFDGNEYKLAFAYTLIKDLNIWDYVTSSYGEFIGTELGLFQLDRNKKSVSKVLSFDESRFNTTNNSIYDLMVDNNNVMWMASREQGAVYWPLQAMRFDSLKANPHPLSSNSVWSIREYNQAIWFGTDNGIVKAQKGTISDPLFANFDPKEVFGLNAVLNIAIVNYRQRESFLLETPRGLQVLDPKSGAVTPLSEIDPQFKHDDFFGGLYQSADYVYFGSNKNYYKCRRLGLICETITDLSEHVATNAYYKFLKPLPSYPSDLLISINSKLIRYNPETKKIHVIYSFGTEDSAEFAVVDSWVIDEKARLWLATSTRGIVVIDQNSGTEIRRFDLKNGLLTNSIYDLQQDDFGAIWASSQKGLYRIDQNDFNIRLFTHQNGLTIDEFNSGASAKLSDGKLAFGSVQGVIVFDPQDFTFGVTTSNLEITEIALMSRDEQIVPSDSIDLRYDDVGLLIRFSNFDFLKQHNNYFSAVMKGTSNATYSDIKLGKLFFSQLKAGKYQLDIEVKEKGSDRTIARKSININAAHPPYLSPVALTCYALFALALILLWLRQNTKKQTLIKSALHEMTNSQKETQLALRATNSGVWEVNLNDKLVSQKRLSVELGYGNLGDKMPLEKHASLIHPQDLDAVVKQWNSVLSKKEQDAAFEVTYRMRAKSGEWVWYQDVGRISEMYEGTPITVSGIYSNITEQKATNTMASILGDAFGQINDWLLILDSNLMPIAANSSFCHAFDINEAKIKSLTFKQFRETLGSKNFSNLLKHIRALEPRQNHREEVLLRTTHNPKHPIQLSINAITKSTNHIDYYVIVLSDLTEQKKTEKEFRFLANYDSLTGLPNRSLMLKRIQKAINQAQNDQLVGLLFIDLDKFKPINDSYGHEVGDKLLGAISRRIEANLFAGCTLGRQSGDEFLVLIESVSSPSDISILVNTLLQALPEKITIDGFTVSISASIGAAIYPFDANNAEKLIRHADVAMIHAKQGGRNSFKFFTTAMNEEILRKLQLETALKTACKENQFFNHYQPIVNSRNNRVVGVELLMRWIDNGQFISPAEFIPVAEEVGLIEIMTDQALKRALVELKPLLQQNGDFYISLNLSAHQVLRANIAEHLVTILYEYGVPCSRLRLEITESTLLADKVKAKTALLELHEEGFILLLDDFGTGYSSLTYLSHFPIDIIKIDQGFVRSMESSSNNKSIVKTITMLAQNLGMTCIAEGVESKEHIRYLSQLGINYMQGYYFSRPVPAEVLLADLYIEEVGNKTKAS